MYKLHSLQYPDWYRTGTSYCYCYIIEIIHHDIVLFFRKPTRPSLPLRKEFFYLSVSPARRAPPFSPSLSSLRDERMQPPSGARNRYAIRLAGHQSPRQVVRDGTAWRKTKYLERQVIDGKSPYLLFRNLHFL